MMLTKEDLQAISELINGAVSASENRIMAYIESDVKKRFARLRMDISSLLKKWTVWSRKSTRFKTAWTR